MDPNTSEGFSGTKQLWIYPMKHKYKTKCWIECQKEKNALWIHWYFLRTCLGYDLRWLSIFSGGAWIHMKSNTDILSGMCLQHITFDLAYVLAFFPASMQAFILAFSLAHIRVHSCPRYHQIAQELRLDSNLERLAEKRPKKTHIQWDFMGASKLLYCICIK